VSNDADERVTVWLSGELRDKIDDEYVNWRYSSRSEWMREAAKTRIALEDALGARGVELPENEADRADLVDAVVRAGVAALDEDTLDSGE